MLELELEASKKPFASERDVWLRHGRLSIS